MGVGAGVEVVGVDVAGIGAGGGVVGAGELGGCRPLRGPLPRACWRAIPRACVRLSAKLRICVRVRVVFLNWGLDMYELSAYL